MNGLSPGPPLGLKLQCWASKRNASRALFSLLQLQLTPTLKIRCWDWSLIALREPMILAYCTEAVGSSRSVPSVAATHFTTPPLLPGFNRSLVVEVVLGRIEVSKPGKLPISLTLHGDPDNVPPNKLVFLRVQPQTSLASGVTEGDEVLCGDNKLQLSES